MITSHFVYVLYEDIVITFYGYLSTLNKTLLISYILYLSNIWISSRIEIKLGEFEQAVCHKCKDGAACYV